MTGDPNRGRSESWLPHWPEYSLIENSSISVVLELGNNIRLSRYNVSRFQFLRSLRQNGVRPYKWRTVNP